MSNKYSDKDTAKLIAEFNTLDKKCVDLQAKLKTEGNTWALPWDGYHLKKGKDKKIRAFLDKQTSRQTVEQIVEGVGMSKNEVEEQLGKYGPDAKRVQFTANGSGEWGVSGKKYLAATE
jgi:hypothetical protein